MRSAIDQLMNLPRYALDGSSAIHPGFERIAALLSVMNHPEKDLSVALVAGTNGKGSVSSMMAAILTADGVRTGLHTSPHLLHVSERMRVDGIAPSVDWMEKQCALFHLLFVSTGASFFEATFALSLLWFAEQHATHAVVEVGLGGRLDATNVLNADVCVITGVALDHTDLLGDTIEKIAVEKAGIIKQDKPIILGNMPSEARSEIEFVAKRLNAPLSIASNGMTITSQKDARVLISTGHGSLPPIRLQLKGEHQLGNTITALTALEQWMPSIAPSSIQQGLKNVSTLSGLRARTEIISYNPVLMVDVGHNPDAVSYALSTFIHACNGIESHTGASCVIIGLMADKDAVEVAKILKKHNLPVLTVPIRGLRGQSEKTLQKTLMDVGVSEVSSHSSVKRAMDWARQSNSNCLVLGSHMVAAEALSNDLGM